LNCLFQRIDQDKKAKITTPFISALLDVMREISFVDADATKPYIGEIFPLILESVKDQSDYVKREVALNTLIAMIDNTGFVVKPYFFYPELLNIIRNLVQSE
jgi:serine/threonine-protein kinase mTOR